MNLLRGNGVELIREIALATRVQHGLERLYQLDRVVDVEHYMSVDAQARETLFVRETEDGVELALRVPALEHTDNLDRLCQIIEGVSHFVYVADRATRDQATTQLELELQAEVDKYVVLSSARGLTLKASEALRDRLYANTHFLDHEGSVERERYETANTAAHRFVRRLEHTYIKENRMGEMRASLRDFYRMGLEDKLRHAHGPV
jgi:hypothetical protein